MTKIDDLFAQNQAWAERVKEADPSFFTESAKGQAPEFLWIGCADSRVPPNVVLDLPPGGVFVHRNIANVVVPSDLNCMSVIQYAVEMLKVKHVIVCGHYECGGVKASMEDADHGLIDNWLHHIREVARRRHADFDEGMSESERVSRLCELNAIEQARNVANTTVLRQAWKEGSSVEVHGWIYSLSEGIVKSLYTHTADGPKNEA